jgi:multiubiquitin
MEDQEHAVPIEAHEVQITVNERPVLVPRHKVTGLEIKQAAINQHVPIELDFVLSEELPDHRSRIIGDGDEVIVDRKSKFNAVAPDDNSWLPMTPAVTNAIEEIRRHFPDSQIMLREDGEGGVFLIVEKVPLGEPYGQQDTWCGFHVTFQYPYSDVYPHFVRGDLMRSNSQALGEAMSPGTFEGRAAIQISRRSKRLNPVTDTAVMKLLKVLKWLKSRWVKTGS